MILTDALSHWPALGRWSPQFFKTQYGHLEVQVDGERMSLGELVDRIEASTEDHPAPYLRNQPLAEWPPELAADVLAHAGVHAAQLAPEPVLPVATATCPPRRRISAVAALDFPVLHYDNWHTHAFLMQLYGEKEYLAFSPDQTAAMYPRDDGSGNRSQLDDLDHPRLTEFPLFEHAKGVRFCPRPGRNACLFPPVGGTPPAS